MFCPRCGQQAAEEVRFCSRCGLALDAAAEIVEAGGNPGWYLARAEGGGLSPRQRGTRKGLLIMTAGLIFFGLAVLLKAFKEDLFVFLPVAALVIIAGLARLLYGLLLEPHAPAAKSAKRAAAADPVAELPGGRRGGEALPPARAVPASVYAKAPADTSDMAAPPSVADATTRLLDKER